MNKEQMQSPQTPSSKTGVWVGLSVLLTALIVGGGVFAWQQQQLSKTEGDLQAQIDLLESKVDEAGDTAAPVKDTSGVELTRHKVEEFGLSFSIPEGCEVSENDDSTAFICDEFENQFSIAYFDSEAYHPDAGSLVDEWMGGKITGADEVGLVEFGGIEMLYGLTQGCPQAYNADEYYFINDGQLFSFQFNHPTCDGEKTDFTTAQQMIRDEILESVEFEKEPDQAWKLISGDETDTCTNPTFSGSTTIHGWYTYEANYIEEEWLFNVVEEDMKKLPLQGVAAEYDWFNRKLKIVDAPAALEEKLRESYEQRPREITIKAYSAYCEGQPNVSLVGVEALK